LGCRYIKVDLVRMSKRGWETCKLRGLALAPIRGPFREDLWNVVTQCSVLHGHGTQCVQDTSKNLHSRTIVRIATIFRLLSFCICAFIVQKRSVPACSTYAASTESPALLCG
jgi:hypothetical protein